MTKILDKQLDHQIFQFSFLISPISSQSKIRKNKLQIELNRFLMINSKLQKHFFHHSQKMRNLDTNRTR